MQSQPLQGLATVQPSCSGSSARVTPSGMVAPTPGAPPAACTWQAMASALRAAFQALKDGEGTFLDRAKRLGDEAESEYVREMVGFILGESDRNFLTPS